VPQRSLAGVQVARNVAPRVTRGMATAGSVHLGHPASMLGCALRLLTPVRAALARIAGRIATRCRCA
jgi:hypothetical protein